MSPKIIGNYPLFFCENIMNTLELRQKLQENLPWPVAPCDSSVKDICLNDWLIRFDGTDQEFWEIVKEEEKKLDQKSEDNLQSTIDNYWENL